MFERNLVKRNIRFGQNQILASPKTFSLQYGYAQSRTRSDDFGNASF